MNRVLGMDIGGANLKLADSEGWADSELFALWRAPHELGSALAALLGRVPENLPLAVTMTGELADCFANKADGVRQILTSLEAVSGARQTRVYRIDGQFIPVPSARAEPYRVAAANWHALATFVSRYLATGTGWLVDVGSTTTDIIPIISGRPTPHGITDTQRLRHGNLMYTGVDRSPVCGVVSAVPYRGASCPVAQELFATMRDVYTVLGDLAESPDLFSTADGRPATKRAAICRLARCLCADAREFGADDAQAFAVAAAKGQAASIASAMAQVLAACPAEVIARGGIPEVVISGQGAFVARRVVERLLPGAHVIDLAEELSRAQTIAAPAFALAVLAAERGVL